ncbi:MAG: aromatic ring-hydroxylating dioxygenase subunit alpha [Planctomycetes bacterium]|nr:aromatic ring-hydroxylating dioxygenase subunit alpha [Planctomycetota bacterium]
MDPDSLTAELERFSAETPIERAWMPPSSWYTSPAFHALESEAVFQDTWQPVARLSELSSAGSYVTGRLANQPWIVVRGDDGELRAFHNTCRHKGREVMTGCGTCEELVCGYHAWSYDSAGRLKSAPMMAGVEDFDREAMGLKPLQVEAWGLWAFIHLGSPPSSLEVEMRELNEGLGAPGWDKLTFHEEKTWQIRCNWKVVCDNYLDGGYHIPHMHPSLDAQIEMGSYKTELYAKHSIQTAPPNKGDDSRIAIDPQERIGDAARYAWVYPNIMINRYGPCLDTNIVTPTGPDSCEVRYEFFFNTDGGTEAQRFIQESVTQSDVTQREDIEICESVQAGLSSKSYVTGRYAPKVELGEHHFHCLLASSLKRALS